MTQLREAETAAGRAAGGVQVRPSGGGRIGPRDLGQDRTRWFPALCWSVITSWTSSTDPREQLPEALTGYITDREGYDHHHRGRSAPPTPPSSATT